MMGMNLCTTYLCVISSPACCKLRWARSCVLQLFLLLLSVELSPVTWLYGPLDRWTCRITFWFLHVECIFVCGSVDLHDSRSPAYAHACMLYVYDTTCVGSRGIPVSVKMAAWFPWSRSGELCVSSCLWAEFCRLPMFEIFCPGRNCFWQKLSSPNSVYFAIQLREAALRGHLSCRGLQSCLGTALGRDAGLLLLVSWWRNRHLHIHPIRNFQDWLSRMSFCPSCIFTRTESLSTFRFDLRWEFHHTSRVLTDERSRKGPCAIVEIRIGPLWRECFIDFLLNGTEFFDVCPDNTAYMYRPSHSSIDHLFRIVAGEHSFIELLVRCQMTVLNWCNQQHAKLAFMGIVTLVVQLNLAVQCDNWIPDI